MPRPIRSYLDAMRVRSATTMLTFWERVLEDRSVDDKRRPKRYAKEM
jgi:hypothetical protein